MEKGRKNKKGVLKDEGRGRVGDGMEKNRSKGWKGRRKKGKRKKKRVLKDEKVEEKREREKRNKF